MTALQPVWQLAADPGSVRVARRHVRDALSAAGHEDWVDDAVLAVSELVTNVVMHARTGCQLSVEVSADWARVSVRDFSAALPAPRHFSEYATTGRGLSLVAQVSADVGVDPHLDGGKVVWFVLDGNRRTPFASPAEEWDLSALLEPEAPTTATAVLVDVPMAMWLAALEHQEAVLRELYLLHQARQHRPSDGSADPLLEPPVDLVGAEQAQRLLTEATDRALQESVSRPSLPRLAPLPEGHPATMPEVPEVLDIPVCADGAGSRILVALQDALDRGQHLARGGRLLARPVLDELVALRDWACDQVIAQGSGVPPTPWDASPTGASDTSRFGHSPPDWNDEPVRTSSRAVVAADDSNRLIAVSQSAADLLGTTPEELVGRRITTIIPPRLRQQHIAGFTRHLTTGLSRVIGVELDLPLLRADGTEVVRRFTIEQLHTAQGRQIYIAWLDRLPGDDLPSPGGNGHRRGHNGHRSGDHGHHLGDAVHRPDDDGR
jgi:PAS domain S-box-containing protein